MNALGRSMICAWGTIITALPMAILADVTTETASDIEIEAASVASARAGTDTRLKFRLYNNTPATVTLTGLRSPRSDAGTLGFYTHHGVENLSPTMVMLPDETLDFSTSHLVARLTGPRTDLERGEVVPFEIVFQRGSAKGEAHVH